MASYSGTHQFLDFPRQRIRVRHVGVMQDDDRLDSFTADLVGLADDGNGSHSWVDE